MKYIIAVALVVALSSSACAAKPERKKPMDNGRPDKTDHLHTPMDLGRENFTVDGYEDNRGGCRQVGDRCGRE